jgi:hypothetical protein
MNILRIFFIAGLLLSACGKVTVELDSATICQTGTKFVPGDTVVLGETADYAAVMMTFGGIRPSGSLQILLPADSIFSPSGSDLPDEDGEFSDLEWGSRVLVQVARCGGEFFYLATVNEVPEPVRDQVCAGDFGGPMKSWPFHDEAILFRPGDGRELWFVTGIGDPGLISVAADGGISVTMIERPTEGRTVTTFVDVGGGEKVAVGVRNCQQVLYYRAVWYSNR